MNNIYNNFFYRNLLLLLMAILGSQTLLACADNSTATPAAAPADAPAATSSTSSGIIAKAPPGGQPLPTPTPPGQDNRKVLTIWTGGWKGNSDYEKFLNGQIDAYRVRNRNMTVDWQDYGTDLAGKFEQAATSSQKYAGPDIILISAGDLYQFSNQGWLNDIIALGGSSLKDDYVPATFEALRSGSVYYALPWLASTRVTIINKRLWLQATLDATKPPRTYAELDTMIPLMVSKTAKDVLPAWVKPDPLVDFLMEDTPLFTVSGDGKSRQAAFPSPSSIAKWEYYQDKSKKGVFDRDGLAKDQAEALKKFADNKLVMVLDGAPLLAGLKNSNAELYSNTLVVPHVTGKAETLPLTIQGWSIPKAAREPVEALSFLKFLNTSENQLAFARLTSLSVPTLKKALTDSYVTGQDEPLAQARTIMAAALDRTRVPEQLLPAPLSPANREKLLAALITAQSNIWNKDTSPRDALAEAAKIWNEGLK